MDFATVIHMLDDIRDEIQCLRAERDKLAAKLQAAEDEADSLRRQRNELTVKYTALHRSRLERRMACPDCGAELRIGGKNDGEQVATLRAELQAERAKVGRLRYFAADISATYGQNRPDSMLRSITENGGPDAQFAGLALEARAALAESAEEEG